MPDAPSQIDKILILSAQHQEVVWADKWYGWISVSIQSDQTTFPIPSNPPLPFEIVSPIEDLLQQGDHGKGADEYEEQSSVSQQIPAWRRVSVSHPS